MEKYALLWRRLLSKQIQDEEYIARTADFSHHGKTREGTEFLGGDIVKAMQPFIPGKAFPR